jgi:hypothetical protein
LFAARWIASLALAMTVPERSGCLTIESEDSGDTRRGVSTVVIIRESGRSSIPEAAVIESRRRGILDAALFRIMR